MNRSGRVATLAVALLPVAAPGVEVDAQGFETHTELIIRAEPRRVYQQLVTNIGRWWNPAHTWTGNASNLSIDARPGGCFCEKGPGGGAEHMRVIHLVPGELLRLSGALGPLQASGVTGSLSWALSAEGGGTKLVVNYRVGGYWKGGFGSVAPAVESVIAEQASRLKHFIETGNPVPSTTAPGTPAR